MTVLGLDLSLTATGWAIARDTTGTWRLATGAGDRRLVLLRGHLRALLDAHGRPALAVLEDLPTHAHAAGITGMVHGAIRTLLITHHIPYALVPPATLKKYATGKGNADKADMRMALYKRTGLDLADDNQVDAWWLWAAGHDHLGHPAVDLPTAQRDALGKIRWPDLEVGVG